MFERPLEVDCFFLWRVIVSTFRNIKCQVEDENTRTPKYNDTNFWLHSCCSKSLL